MRVMREAARSSAASCFSAVRSAVGYPMTTSAWSSASHRASGSVKARMPWYPCRCAARRIKSRLRTDLLATRMVACPPVLRASSAALASKASRSTTANGGSRCSVALAS
jgi:hypothetical protein